MQHNCCLHHGGLLGPRDFSKLRHYLDRLPPLLLRFARSLSLQERRAVEHPHGHKLAASTTSTVAEMQVGGGHRCRHVSDSRGKREKESEAQSQRGGEQSTTSECLTYPTCYCSIGPPLTSVFSSHLCLPFSPLCSRPTYPSFLTSALAALSASAWRAFSIISLVKCPRSA